MAKEQWFRRFRNSDNGLENLTATMAKEQWFRRFRNSDNGLEHSTATCTCTVA